jgi:hypothetical protein
MINNPTYKHYKETIRAVLKHDAANHNSVIGALYAVNGGKNYYVNSEQLCILLSDVRQMSPMRLMLSVWSLSDAKLIEHHPKDNSYIRLVNLQSGEYARKSLLQIHPSFKAFFEHFHRVLVDYLPDQNITPIC